MKKNPVFRPQSWLAAAVSLLVFCGMGCEDDDDDHENHVPPDGQGSLVVQNRTVDDVNVYVDGSLDLTVNDDSTGIHDLPPGLYRIIIEDEDDDRDWQGSVDILEGRLTVLRVTPSLTDLDDYRVSIEYE